jgi:hypothetical protein
MQTWQKIVIAVFIVGMWGWFLNAVTDLTSRNTATGGGSGTNNHVGPNGSPGRGGKSPAPAPPGPTHSTVGMEHKIPSLIIPPTVPPRTSRLHIRCLRHDETYY